MAESHAGQIDNVMKEDRLFPPSAEFAAKARIGSLEQYEKLWKEAADDIEGFWGKLGCELHWFKPYDKVLEWNEPFAKWFVGGQTNVSYNCLDAHLGTPRRNKAAFIWEGEPGDVRVLTYRNAAPRSLQVRQRAEDAGHRPRRRGGHVHADGARAGHRHAGLRRIGAVHSVVFGGFSAEAIADRNNDAKAKLMITADAGWRRGKQIPLKENVDAALDKSPTVEKCVVVAAPGSEVTMQAGRDFWWHELMANASADCPAEPMDSETPLFILYTSGSTGKPKGIKHTTAGYNLYGEEDDGVGVRHPRRGRVLVYGRHRLDHRPHLRRLRPAVGRGDRASCTKARPTRPTRTAGGR